MTAGSGRLLGREAEVERVLQVLTGENGGCVAVVGAAGIGKSALVREVAARVGGGGVVVRSTAGAVSEAALPFVGLHDLIGAELTTDAVDLPGPLRAALEGAVLRTRPTEGGVDPVAVNLAVLRVVEQLSAGDRLVLVLDDLPWVDAATRSVLAFVLRRLRPERVAVLVAMRPDAPPVDLVGPAEVHTVAVGPLDATTLVAVVEQELGERLPHRLAGQLHEASGGNPLLALELARTAAVEHDALAELTVPERYRTILMPRLAGLSPRARRSLLAASLLSRPTLEELADVVSVDGLLEAEAAGVLRVRDGGVEFTHPLFASLCRAVAGTAERRDLHALLARTARDEIGRAWHLGAATLLPDEEVAARLAGAADRARSRAAVAAAAELALAAERLTPTGDLERRTARACVAARLFFQNGDVDAAAAVLRGLLGDLAPGPLRSRCLTALAQVTSVDSVGAAALLREALHQPGLDAGAVNELRFEIGGVLGSLGDLAGSRAGIGEVEAYAVAAGREDLARRCRAHLAWLDLVTGTAPADSAGWRCLVEEADRHELGYLHPDLVRAWEAMGREDNTRALALVDALMERARQTGDIGLWAMFAQHRADVELRRGHVDAAYELATEAHRILADGRHDESPLYFRAITAAWQGRLDEARADAGTALAMARHDHHRLLVAPCHHALGFVELSVGRPGAAARHYDAVATEMAVTGWRHPGLLVWHGNAVEALVGAGRRADAATVADELATLAERLDLTTSAALALRCRALLLEDAGDVDAAAAALDESLSLSGPLDNPLEHARTLLVRGIVHRRRRQKARSREDLRQARDVFDRLGARAWAARADRELARSSSAVAGPGLTGTERAVAELAVSGSTNREIAAALFLSEKTVEAVLTRVYRKLSVRSRTELGHLAALAPDPEGRA